MLIVVPTVTLFAISYDHGTRYVKLGGWVAGWLYKAGKAWSLPISLANIASCGCKRCHGQILAAVSREGMSHSRTLIVMFHICICWLYVPHKYFKSRPKNSHNLHFYRRIFSKNSWIYFHQIMIEMFTIIKVIIIIIAIFFPNHHS